jgi:hypothetical protein
MGNAACSSCHDPHSGPARYLVKPETTSVEPEETADTQPPATTP